MKLMIISSLMMLFFYIGGYFVGRYSVKPVITGFHVHTDKDLITEVDVHYKLEEK